MVHVEQIATLPGHQNPVYTVEPSQKPGIIFTAGNDKGVVEWSLRKREFIKVMFPVASSVYSLHCPVNAPILMAGERNGQVDVFDFIQQKITSRLIHHKLPVFDIKSVKSKSEILVASEDGTVSVWNLLTYELLYSFKVSNETVRVIAVSPDEKLVAFGSKDAVIRIYNLTDFSLIEELKEHQLPITSLCFSPDGRFLLSGSRDAQLKAWAVPEFNLHQSVPAHLFAIYDIKFHPVLPYFATASRDKTIKIWDADLKLLKIISIEKGYPNHILSVNKIAWDPETGNLISVSDDKLMMIWNVEFDS
ncbi:WD40 repeat domain-containing protein [Pedobacter sp. HMF7647]|uniref:WD40 repeat domain-containing protein n=1 Tax=Hufsiella arboris TaxID=2695275 RepID=A0A7K1YDX2_9SPHI|nr:WD40 repeat domain-containing protein [Hufsiella arboris]MXV52600.1 WD40 repeat domain-containing protein [Hufsiella arboris]